MMTDVAFHTPPSTPVWGAASSAHFLVPIARAIFAALFVMTAMGQFTPAAIEYAQTAGVPFARLLVPVSGVIATIGGLSVLFGYRAKLGALLILVFIVPVTLVMHDFWTLADPVAQQAQLAMFLRNLAIASGALVVLRFGAGPLSVDELRGTPVAREA